MTKPNSVEPIGSPCGTPNTRLLHTAAIRGPMLVRHFRKSAPRKTSSSVIGSKRAEDAMVATVGHNSRELEGGSTLTGPRRRVPPKYMKRAIDPSTNSIAPREERSASAPVRALSRGPSTANTEGPCRPNVSDHQVTAAPAPTPVVTRWRRLSSQCRGRRAATGTAITKGIRRPGQAQTQRSLCSQVGGFPKAGPAAVSALAILGSEH